MQTPIPANVAEYLRRISRGSEFQAVIEYLRVELEEAKTTLIVAPPERVQRLQGRAEALKDVLELVDPKPFKQLKVTTLP